MDMLRNVYCIDDRRWGWNDSGLDDMEVSQNEAWRMAAWVVARDKKDRDYYVAETIRKGVALQVRTMRRNRGWTQEQLGLKAGMPQPTISRIESGKYLLSRIDIYEKLAAAFDVAVIIRFSPFSEMLTENSLLDVQSFDEDEGGRINDN